MFRLLFIVSTALFILQMNISAEQNADRPIKEWRLEELEKRLDIVNSELKSLAHFSLRSGVGSIGYRSRSYSDPDNTEWVTINLDQDTPIEQIILVPTIWRDIEEGLTNDAFPAEFNVIIGNTQNPEGKVIAHFDEDDNILPRIAPFVIQCKGLMASWVRIEATKLSQRVHNGDYIFQLSEILIFNGAQNVALEKPVEKNHGEDKSLSNCWNHRFLVDGYIPYLMNAAHGEQSLATIYSSPNIDASVTLTIDLEKEHEVSSIYLHAVEQSDTVPQSTAGDFGLPKHIIVEGSQNGDFSDSVQLLDRYWNDIYEQGPIIMLPFSPTKCRYIRITALDPYLNFSSDGNKVQARSGFSEIEINSFGVNVSKGKTVTSSIEAESLQRPTTALTDGLNLYGDILPTRQWLNELSKRHELEQELPLLENEIKLRYAKQKKILTRFIWLSILLAVILAFTLLIDRMLRMREVSRIRLKFAADLHDELGANIHTIGILGDIALKSTDDPERLKTALERSRRLTERTGTAVRHCINLQEANGLYGSIAEEFERTARRIMSNKNYSVSIEGKDYLDRLKPQDRTDLALFYKECLVNTSRHAEATNCITILNANAREIRLTVMDNGKGIEDSIEEKTPKSLKRRARILGAKISVDSSPEEGTKVQLSFKYKRRRIFR